ncbi:MAG: hypothetical protein BMS9Abin36_2039 [Gammaproteobacteria bacterium]|nr:MAG: hypothetical protein BMS9Abin36_2039 [Gammaproteobacteria bacterium]
MVAAVNIVSGWIMLRNDWEHEDMNASPSTSSSKTPLNTQAEIKVSKDDLPLHCPMPGMSAWDSHPRVFLPIEESGRERCPYCGTVYILKN